MQKEKIDSNYLDYIQDAKAYLKSSQYGATLENLYLAKLMQKKDWKADFGIMMTEDEDDFWSSLCIFNMCYNATGAVCSSGCCSECCALIGIAACFSICCKGDIDHAGPCLAECLVDYFKCLCWCCSCY